MESQEFKVIECVLRKIGALLLEQTSKFGLLSGNGFRTLIVDRQTKLLVLKLHLGIPRLWKECSPDEWYFSQRTYSHW